MYYSRLSLNTITVAIRVILLVAVCLWATVIVGTRGVDVGTDTSAYAHYFDWSHGQIQSLEPGFSLISYGAAQLGMSLIEYQILLFLLLIATVILSTIKYYNYLEIKNGYLSFLVASLTFLYFSPLFVGASINVIRQGLSVLLVFSALLSFQKRQWFQFLAYGVAAASFHYSALIIFFFSPILLLNYRSQLIIIFSAAFLYLSGISIILVKYLVPEAYTFVSTYGHGAVDINITSALFSLFLISLLPLMSRITYPPYRKRIVSSGSVLLVMLLPYFALGWGDYATRYRYTGWLAFSLMVAAVFYNSRVSIMRHHAILDCGLILSVIAFYIYIEYLGIAGG